MPCFHPLPAWKRPNGTITLKATEGAKIAPRAGPAPDDRFFYLPCSTCLGCQQAQAKAWGLRCELESNSHTQQCWATLTYDDRWLPPTLSKRHLQLFLKRLRARIQPTRLRFFASGEYGEYTHREHYHAILWGIDQHNQEIQNAWPYGHARVDPLDTPAIYYVAGYCNKKLGYKEPKNQERVDPRTGEVYIYQPPFRQMSRGGRNSKGIAHDAKKYWKSWRDFAVTSGTTTAVPRYLHQSWKDNATPEQIEQRNFANYIKHLKRENTDARDMHEILRAKEQHALKKHQLAKERRNTL